MKIRSDKNLEKGLFLKDIPGLGKPNNPILNVFEWDEKRISSSVFLPLHFTRKVPKDNVEEKRIADLLIYKTQQALFLKLHTNIGPADCDKLCRKCISTYSTDIDFENHQKHCSEHEPCLIKVPKETTVRITKFFYKKPYNLLRMQILKQ